jgi:GINS complex subunit 4
MDIDDILREVDPPTHYVSVETRDLQALTRAWVTERSSPELLPYVYFVRAVLLCQSCLY